MENKKLWFAGIDWASEIHQARISDVQVNVGPSHRSDVRCQRFRHAEAFALASGL